MHWKNWLKLIGLSLFLWLMAGLDWPQLILLARTLDPVYLTAYAGAFALMVLTRSMRLRLALSRMNHALSFKDCYIATLEPAFMGMLTPGRLGEFSRVGYLQSHGVGLPEATGIVLVERLVDMLVLLVFGAAGVLYIFWPAFGLAGVGAVVGIGLAVLLFLIRRASRTLRLLQGSLHWLGRWEPARLRQSRLGLMASLHLVLQRTAQPIFYVGLCCISLNFLQVFLLAKAFHFQSEYLMVIFAYSSSTLVSTLPISIGGLGTREATYILIMGRIGISREQALLFSLTDGLVFGVLMLFALLLPFWLKNLLLNRPPASKASP